MTSLHSTRALGRASQQRTPVLTISCRHPGARRPAPSSKPPVKPSQKKRDISTSFRRGPVPRPLTNLPASSAPSTPEEQAAQEEELPLLGMPTGLSSLHAKPVAPAVIELLPDIPSLAALPLADAAAEALLWASSSPDASVVDPLASMDRVLSSLIVAPSAPGSSTSSSSAPASGSNKKGSGKSGSSKASSSSTADTAELAATARAALAAPKAPHALAAIAAPAVTVIHCETDYERELAAAAALNQLLVCKVESSRTLLQGGLDSSLRFQTNSNLPTPLNTYRPPNESHTPLGLLGGSHGSSGSGHLVSTAEVLHSLGFPVGFSASSGGSISGGFATATSSSSSSEPFSPVHAWYKQLATKYAHAAAVSKAVSPIRFLSLQSDSAPARVVCRRLGVSAGLSVVLVDAAKSRRVQEVLGTKIEQELPNGLLYFGGSDPQGLKPADRLAQLNSQADLDALRSSAQLAVVSLQMRAAPPCIRAYARLYAVAQQHSGASASALAFGVMDVDASPQCGAVGTQLGLEQLPTYIIYKDGVEVDRLGTSPDRRRLGEVVAQHMGSA